MQVGEEAQLHPPGCELLHPDPQECSQVAHKAWGEPGEVSVGLRGPRTSGQHRDVKGLRAPKAWGRNACGTVLSGGGGASTNQGESRVPHTCTAGATPLEELEEDVGGNSPGQGVPRCLFSQQVYYGENKSKHTMAPKILFRSNCPRHQP